MRSLAVAVGLLLLVAPPAAAAPAWMRVAHIVVPGDVNTRTAARGVRKHNDNTDRIVWTGTIWFVHRTAGSQILGPNSSLRVYGSRNGGRTFRLQAIVATLDLAKLSAKARRSWGGTQGEAVLGTASPEDLARGAENGSARQRVRGV